MYPITDIAYEIRQLKTRLENMLRTGTVSAIYADEGLVDVAMEKITRKRLPFLTMRAGTDKTYWMPSVGEQGVVLSPSGDLANAFFLPALNSDLNPVPETDENLSVREWADGAKETYDKAAHEYQLQIQENKHLKANRSEIEVKFNTGGWKVDGSEAELAFGATKIVVNATGITLTFGASSITLNATGITLTGAIINNQGVLQVVNVPLMVP